MHGIAPGTGTDIQQCSERRKGKQQDPDAPGNDQQKNGLFTFQAFGLFGKEDLNSKEYQAAADKEIEQQVLKDLYGNYFFCHLLAGFVRFKNGNTVIVPA